MKHTHIHHNGSEWALWAGDGQAPEPAYALEDIFYYMMSKEWAEQDNFCGIWETLVPGCTPENWETIQSEYIRQEKLNALRACATEYDLWETVGEKRRDPFYTDEMIQEQLKLIHSNRVYNGPNDYYKWRHL